jgi:hypothetical protein
VIKQTDPRYSIPVASSSREDLLMRKSGGASSKSVRRRVLAGLTFQSCRVCWSLTGLAAISATFAALVS